MDRASTKLDTENNESSIPKSRHRRTVIESLVYGSLSSAVSTVIFQPLELLKTKIQIRDGSVVRSTTFGRASSSAAKLIKQNGISYLWTGTAPSLVRSIPGVGIYYASLNVLQNNFSSNSDAPDNGGQAFYFGLASRSLVSLLLLPVTVVKVRYESGLLMNSKLMTDLINAYTKTGWLGAGPTILRDSLFSGIYYMCYTELKSRSTPGSGRETIFVYGLMSGLVAAVISNPFDVLKTNIQASNSGSIKIAVGNIMSEKNGLLRLFDGLGPRTLRRTLIAASTWTFYELLTERLTSK